MPRINATSAASPSLVQQPQRPSFGTWGNTFQQSAFSLFNESFGAISYSGDEVSEYGMIYTPYKSLRETIDSATQIGGLSALARAQNLTALSRKLGGLSANKRLDQVSQRLLTVVNEKEASREAQKVGSRLIGMQFQLAGLGINQMACRDGHPPKPRIDERGCFEHIGNNSGLATLRAGIYGRPAVLTKRVEFLKACQSEAKRYLADQIREDGESGSLFSGEDLVHRARLTLIAAPTDYLRQHHVAAGKIFLELSSIDRLSRDVMVRCSDAPTTSTINSTLAESDCYQEACGNLREALIEFGNPVR